MVKSAVLSVVIVALAGLMSYAALTIVQQMTLHMKPLF